MKSKHGKDGSNNDSKAGTTASSSKSSVVRALYVRVETVDKDETETLLNYTQSPYMHRNSFDKPNAQYLQPQSDGTRSQYISPSYLSINAMQNVRRSSTSDIVDDKLPAIPSSVSQQDNRRPSTSDLLRRARERKGGPGESSKIGRSISQGGLPRGGRAGRRTSLAF